MGGNGSIYATGYSALKSRSRTASPSFERTGRPSHSETSSGSGSKKRGRYLSTGNPLVSTASGQERTALRFGRPRDAHFARLLAFLGSVALLLFYALLLLARRVVILPVQSVDDGFPDLAGLERLLRLDRRDGFRNDGEREEVDERRRLRQMNLEASV